MKDIIFESGRIKSLEKKFLSRTDFEKIIDAPDFKSSLSEIEKGFYRLKDITLCQQIINFFESEREKLIKEIEQTLPENLSNFFKIKYDFHNLKVFLKERFGIKGNEIYSFSGIVDPYSLKYSLENRDFDIIPEILKDTLMEFAEIKSDNPDTYFSFLRKEYYRIIKNLIEKEKNGFLNGYISIEIDFANISSFLLKKQKDELIDGGNIKKEDFYDEKKLWKSVKEFYPYVEVPIKEKDYEKVKKNAIINFLKSSRRIGYGIEVIFSYFSARFIEMENLQRILIGKFYNLPSQILKDWIIDCYC
ncbi:MAG: hypothetical protein DRP67_03705 [Candidatus Omnitrophota bacterium]|nr:MAG: hypothetical protein DRP67_03705 [Candidatus Omnitrophota bacterium]